MMQKVFLKNWEKNMNTNSYKIILTDTAKEELQGIYEYISNKLLEKQIAKKLMNKIEQNIMKLEQNPYLYSKVCVKPHNDTYRRLIIDNYVALYDIEENEKQVIIYRILYGRMDYLNIEEL